jgi:hypothetical protein
MDNPFSNNIVKNTPPDNTRITPIDKMENVSLSLLSQIANKKVFNLILILILKTLKV